MGIRERLQNNTEVGVVATESRRNMANVNSASRKLRTELLDRLDFVRAGALSDKELREQIRHILETIIEEQELTLGEDVIAQIIRQVEDETLGLGPIEALLQDPNISDILINGPNQVYVERFGKLELTRIRFRSEADLRHVIDRIVSRVGRRIDESSPMVDARLLDGSRVNAIIPPLALDGSSLSIRRFGKRAIHMDDLLTRQALTPAMAKLLHAAVRARMNIIISGGTGSGKTTLLNALSESISNDERVITIEDSAELRLLQPHIVRLETRPPNLEQSGEVTARDLMRNALRMRPERIIIGECRGAESLDMLQAMNTGHDGSMTTVHANSTRDVLARLETLVLFAGFNMPESAIRGQIASAIDLIVQASRLSDGTRRVMSISEVTGMEGPVVATQDIFTFNRRGIGEKGEVLGSFSATGVIPAFLEQLQLTGAQIDPAMFDPGFGVEGHQR